MFIQFFIGALILLISVIIHAICFDLIIKKIRSVEKWSILKGSIFKKAVIIALVILMVSGVLIVDVWIWGLTYLGLGAIETLEASLYFSTSTFTTVGFGDLVLGQDWRLLSSVESLNGMLLFGWSTAFIFEVVSKIYTKEGDKIKV